MNIFFDVDYTVVDAEGLLRPHVREVFESLVADGHHLYLWSGAGPRWDDVDEHSLRGLISDCFVKPLENYESELMRLGVPLRPDYVVDDYPEIVAIFGGTAVSPFGSYGKNPGDTEMLRVYEAIKQFVSDNETGD